MRLRRPESKTATLFRLAAATAGAAFLLLAEAARAQIRLDGSLGARGR